jgi:APA family basic amino acid/polyamine antiporter
MRKSLFVKKSKISLELEAVNSKLKKSLGLFDLTMMGVGAIIGTGIFVLTGEAAAGTVHALGAGPAITLSFIITGLACCFAALCYAEFASMIPISGSAYTYSYYSFGEFIAWIIGWDLILEYAIGNVAVAIGWAGYFKHLLDGFGFYMPGWMSGATGTDMVQLPSGSWAEMTVGLASQYGAPLSSFPHQTAILNLPAFVITLVVTVLLYIGIKESARVTSFLVILKLVLIAIFLIYGFPHFQPVSNWHPFAPNGWKGIMSGAALVFFAYVGFDAVSTTAEEAKNPQRDLPRAMIIALILCTILYVVVAGLLTGMVPLDILKNEHPVAAALNFVGEGHVSLLISVGIVLTMPTVLLVMQLGQIRILYSMSRDKLLGPAFSKVHPRFLTPAFATVVVGGFVAILSGTIGIGVAAELTNIGTLFAFILIAIGIWILRVRDPYAIRKFRVPMYRVIVILCVGICFLLILALPYLTWIRFVVWMLIGFGLYYTYGFKHGMSVSEQ